MTTLAIIISIASLVVSILSFLNSFWWSRRVERRAQALVAAQNVEIRYDNAGHELTVFNNSAQTVTVHHIVAGNHDFATEHVEISAHDKHQWSTALIGVPEEHLRWATVAFYDSGDRAWERSGRHQPRLIREK